MISVKYLNRGYDDSIALIPGWATDYRIFAHLDIKFNYLLPVNFSPFKFEEDILKALETYKMRKVSLFGWSLGAFVAAEFASRHPDMVDKLFLIGAGRRYSTEGIEKIKKYINKNKEAYLYSFYNDCFPDKNQLGSSTQSLLKAYRKEQDAAHLLKTLDYLERAEINPDELRPIKDITIAHGDKDKIAPLKEAASLKNDIPRARFVLIKSAGHAPFFKKDFDSLLWPPRK